MAAKTKPRLAVFISGSGRTLLNLHARAAEGSLEAEIALVVASRECDGAQKARDLGLPVRVMSGEIDPGELERLLGEYRIDWVVLAGYLHRLPIPPGFEGRVVNIHPALLPRHGGPGMYGRRVHEAVLRAGDRESGCTVHLCDAIYDNGPVVLQARCPVLEGDTAETLAARVFELEKRAYPEALARLFAGS